MSDCFPLLEKLTAWGVVRGLENRRLSLLCAKKVMAVKGNWGNYAMLVYVAFVVERRAYRAVALTTYNLVRCYRRLTFLNLSSLVNCNDLGVGSNYIQTILCGGHGRGQYV